MDPLQMTPDHLSYINFEFSGSNPLPVTRTRMICKCFTHSIEV